MSEKDYKRWLEHGPEQLSLSETTAALDWRDGNPEAAFHIKMAHDTQRREKEAKATLRSTWIADGGDISQFEDARAKLSAEKRQERLKAMEAEAKAESWREMKRGF
jgi:hypothetical protein